MPDTAEKPRREAADGRHVHIDHDRVSFAGTSVVHGELDLADALDLDDAVRTIAGQLGDLGSTESLDVRRSLAAGGFEARCARTSTSGKTRQPVRKTVLHGHLSQAALRGDDTVGRCENTRSPITVEQIRDWCGHPDTHLTIKPIIDLQDHVHVHAYEVPDRITERVALLTTPAYSPGAPAPPAP